MVNNNFEEIPAEPFIQDILKTIVENESVRYALLSKKEALTDIIETYERKLKELPALEMDMVRFKMDMTFDSEAEGTPTSTKVEFDAINTLRLTLGLGLNYRIGRAFAEYNVASTNSFAFGLTLGK